MPMPQQFVQDLGGTIDEYMVEAVDRGAGVTPQVTVLGPDETVYANAQAATLDAVNTTVSGTVARGATTVAVTASTNIVAGRRYLLGTANTEPTELVRCRSLTGTTVTLSRPTLYAHATLVGFVGTRLSYAVTAAQATTLFFDGFARWNWADLGSATRNRQTFTALECVLRPTVRLASTNDLHVRDPKLYRKIDAELDADEVLDTAYEDCLSEINPKSPARTIVGANGLIVPTVYRALWIAASQFGEGFVYLRDLYETEWKRAIEQFRKNFPDDADQDGSVEPHERAFSSIRFGRA